MTTMEMLIMAMQARRSQLEFPAQDTIFSPPQCTLESMQALNEKRLTTGKPYPPYNYGPPVGCSCCLEPPEIRN